MKQVLLKEGKTIVEEVPAPCLEPGTLIVQVSHSAISMGTELSGMRASEMPLWKRALRQPEKAKRAVQMALTQGVSSTWNFVHSKVSAPQPTGYSAAGVVLEVGEGVEGFQRGDRVACSGTQCAFHAEIIRVPFNLAVPVPEGLGSKASSTVAIGAVALQAVRRAHPTLGESFVVVGLGLVGQLVAQILRANGCRIIGTDLDPKRIRLAKELGLHVGLCPEEVDDVESVVRLTDGIGADGVVITAASPSNAIVSAAFRMCRKKGRVVLVGDVGLDLKRSDIYYKELDFFISTSYGPGRYDRSYEEGGLDYPVGYIRWTETRNMAEFLRLAAEGRVNVEALIAGAYPVDRASDAYETLRSGGVFPPLLVLSYPEAPSPAAAGRTVPNPAARSAGPGQVRLAVVGAGAFAKSVHLPNLGSMKDLFYLQALMNRSGHNANYAANQFGAKYATTDYGQVLTDEEVDAVLIATRHDLHASMALQALRAGKHVFVEKPLALRREDLKEIEDFYASLSPGSPAPVLMTGFNRRFSPYALRIWEAVQGRTNPMIVSYRMNAGYISLDHWVHSSEGGGRNIGEACHIYDLFTFLTGSRLASVSVQAIRPKTRHYAHHDNFIATLSFDDGSLASLVYTALGADAHSKEQMEVFVDGAVFALDNYNRLRVAGAKVKGVETRLAEKGHAEELKAFARVIRDGGEWPIPLWHQVQVTETAFRVEELLGGQR